MVLLFRSASDTREIVIALAEPNEHEVAVRVFQINKGAFWNLHGAEFVAMVVGIVL
jgi:hypothetical protein